MLSSLFIKRFKISLGQVVRVQLRRGWVIFAAFGLFTLSSFGEPTRTTASPRELEAIYIINFCRFTTWPTQTFASPNASVKIGIWGNDPLMRLVKEAANGESIGQQPIEVESVHDASQIGAYSLLYVSESAERQFEHSSDPLPKGTLLIGESPNFLKTGGHIQFIKDGAHIKLRVNLNGLKRCDLELSSRLLRIAEISPNP